MLLEIAGLTKHFGGLTAVADISFGIDKGEIIGLFGPNGSGKTTLLNLIAGLIPASAGRIVWKGKNIAGWQAHEIAAAGLVKTRSEEHTSELQSREKLVCRLLLEKKNQ